jgi:hypothetical protein
MRIRKKRKHWPVALLCPIHKCLMRVRCVIGLQQYRYCPVKGCKSAVQTLRTKLPRRRGLREEASPAKVTSIN